MKRSDAMRKTLIMVCALFLFAAHPVLGQQTENEQQQDRQIIATIGSTTLTTKDIEALIHKRAPFARQALQDRDKLKKLVDEEINALIIAEGAKQAGIDKLFSVRESANKHLVQLFIRKEIEHKIAANSISEAEARKFFQDNASKYEQPEQRRASHILVKTKDKAIAIAKQAKGLNPQDFIALTRENSLDEETRLRGGDLMFFTREGRPLGGADAPVDQALVDAAFTIDKVGALATASVTLGNDRFSIVRLTDIRLAIQKTFEQVKKKIERLLIEQQKQVRLKTMLRRLRETTEIQTHPLRLDAIKLPKPKARPKGGQEHSH